ncbi:MAG: MBL fold metallo-hydrolase [Nitrososphaerales archaeon]|nr:MBL fold metallo-hydrolase [Nitrososphaerales archaeon]
MWSYGGVKVHWLGHDSFVLQGSKTIVIDPFKAQGNFKADILLISHEHSDHLSEDDIKRFSSPSTTIVAPKICEEPLKKLGGSKKFIAPGDTLEIEGATVGSIPAYNLNKFREPGKVFHPKADGRVGYIVTLDGVRFYHAGDSDATPEMKALDVDVALLPVSGTYVMTADEAAEAAKAMKVKVAVPMHYGKIVGTRADAERFKKLLEGKRAVEILEKE